ncbi:MAG: hypothetical protein AB7O93_08000 [Vicinamibacterales bacterium]
MLWHKAWVDARWRLIAWMAVLTVLACGVVIQYPEMMRLRGSAAALDPGDGRLARLIRDAVETQRDFRGYVWYQWFNQNLLHLWVLAAAVLGSGGLVPSGPGGAELFTAALPVSRRRIFAVRAATDLAGLAALALLPSLAIPLLAGTIGQRYPAGAVAVHAFCLFAGGSAFYGAALGCSAVVSGVWRPLLLTLGGAVALGALEYVVPWPGVFTTMSGESYLRHAALPWVGLLTAGAAAAALLALGSRRFERRDF